MPRIPEGKFNSTPSVRVGAQKVTMPQQTGLDRALKAGQQITNAMAKLQDQRERTDAMNAATDSKRAYEEKKSKILTAMEASDENGNFEYIDPMSDPDNPVKISGNLQEELNNLHKDFNKSQLELSNLERGDIAMDLNQQYVGDDMNRLRINAGKALFRKKKKKLKDSSIQVIEFGMTNLMGMSADGTSPEVMKMSAINEVNKIDRHIANAGASLGADEIKDLKKKRDKMFTQTAERILNNKMDANTVALADQLIGNIHDPLEKTYRVQRLEKIKKEAAKKHDQLFLAKAKTAAKPFEEGGGR